MPKAPAFWEMKGVVSTLFLPLAAIYQRLYAAKMSGVQPVRLPVPVVCAGNVVVGGAGKTPLVLWLMRYFKERGVQAHCISRGYKGQLEGPVLVDLTRHGYKDVGDEPLLIAREGPCWVGRKRVPAARAAAAAGAQVIVMDDGLQNFSLEKDLTFLVVDGGYGFGNGRALPAGPLREPAEVGAARADAAVIIGEDIHGTKALFSSILPVLSAKLMPENDRVLPGPAVAFAGIGRPEKFFATAEEAGYLLLERIRFPDHHCYSARDLTELKATAEKQQCRLLTTAKDAVRLPHAMQEDVDVLDVTLVFEAMDKMDSLLQLLLAKVR